MANEFVDKIKSGRFEHKNWTVLCEIDDTYSINFKLIESEEIEDAEHWGFEGYVKWDGCSNWKTISGNYDLHFCGVEKLQEFTDLLLNLKKAALELIGE
jgi:hypothetical protein